MSEPNSPGTGCTWPEQEAVEKWWREHSMELKKAVTAYRVKVQNEHVVPRRQTVEDTIHENGVLLTRDPNGRIIEIRAGGQWVYLLDCNEHKEQQNSGPARSKT
jgi:hypothetical protein